MKLPAILLMLGLLAIVSLHVSGQEGATAGSAPPDTVTYQTWFAEGTSVAFAHNLHADLLGLACSECHHAENCRSCHLERRVTALATNSRIALHGVCFRCHQQGATLAECDFCHTPISDDNQFGGVEKSVKLDPSTRKRILETLTAAQASGELRIVGEALPFERETPPPPQEHIFLASQEEGVSLVYFPHTAHSGQYGITCAACHHMQGCGHCHRATNTSIEVVSARTALMDHCVRCHEAEGLRTSCESCHQEPHPRVNAP